jgi:hypothetical protein
VARTSPRDELPRRGRPSSTPSSPRRGTICGERLDGRTNAERSDDLDYARGTCPSPATLTSDEKGLITRWIDIGCPIDLDDGTRPRLRYAQDNLVPVMTVRLEDAGGVVRLRVGLLDLESGIDPGSLDVRIEVPGAAPVRIGHGDLAFDPASGVGTANLPIQTSQFSSARPLKVVAEVADEAGNRERLRLTVGSVAP